MNPMCVSGIDILEYGQFWSTSGETSHENFMSGFFLSKVAPLNFRGTLEALLYFSLTPIEDICDKHSLGTQKPDNEANVKFGWNIL